MKDIVAEGLKLSNEDRPSDYGHPYDDFTRSSGMLSSLGYRFVDANGNIRVLDATDVPIIQMCVKLSREVNKHKDDNIVDIIGYGNTLDKVYARKKQIEETEKVLNRPKSHKTAKAKGH